MYTHKNIVLYASSYVYVYSYVYSYIILCSMSSVWNYEYLLLESIGLQAGTEEMVQL